MSAFIILVIAFVIRGISGFGSGLIAIPLLALMLPISITVPLVTGLDYIASFGHGVKHRKNTQWQSIVILLPFSISGVLIALYLFNTIDGLLLKKALGYFIIIYAFYSLFMSKPHRHKSKLWAVPGGIFGGLIGTLFGTGGPFYVIYLQLQGLGKSAFRATIATVFFFDGSVRMFAYTVSGFFSIDTLILMALSLPVMILGMIIGGHIHTNISHQTIQRGIGFLLLFSGTALVL